MGKLKLLTVVLGLLGGVMLCGAPRTHAADMSKGLMLALPVAHGPKINGSLKGWNLAAADPIWMSVSTAKKMNALAALEYTQRALYYGVRVTLPDRKITNTNGPSDAFWNGDEVELRVVADPAVAYPANPGAANVKANPRVCHLTFWKDTINGKCYINIAHGAKFNLGSQANPVGSEIKIVEHGQHGYTMTARIPWSAMDAPGGIMPFKPGEKMAAILGIHWGGIMYAANALYRKSPGGFAFSSPQDWGQVEFAKTGHIAPQYPPLAKFLAGLKTNVHQGVPITVQVPRKEHVSINIFGPHGQVIRELMTGAVHKKGPITVYWNGRNGWGAAVPLGTYKWGAYFSPGIKAKYVGTVGSSGTPPYPTVDGIGGWGGDHGPCIGAAADKTGMYFLWTSGERQSYVVKTNVQYQTMWRISPYMGGGYNYAIAANGKRVFVVFRGSNPEMFRLNARTGQLLNWPHGGTTVVISHSKMAAGAVPADSTPLRAYLGSRTLDQYIYLTRHLKRPGLQPQCVGLAANSHEVFASVYSKNQIRIFNPHTGKLLGALVCAGPRGVCLDSKGNLFAVSYVSGQPGKIVEFIHAAGVGHVVVSDHLAMPWGVAVDGAGRIHVTDEGTSQQVKVFLPTGQLIQTLGKRGGRPWVGKYVASNYLRPAGIAADFRGGILTAQAALPKVFSLNSSVTGQVMKQWFGCVGYWGQVSPSPVHPRTVYYQLEPLGVARARVIGRNTIAAPQAYWLLPRAGFHSVGTLGFDYMAQDDVVLADNHRQYFVCDAEPHGIALVQGNQMLPVAHFLFLNSGQKGNPYHRNVLEIWSDTNGDHHIQPNEVQQLFSIGGKPLPPLAGGPGSMWMARNGDVYLATEANSIIEIPAKDFLTNGTIVWNTAKAHYAVPVVFNRRLAGRMVIVGMRVNAKGDLYACVAAIAAYHSKAETKAMSRGIGHDSDFNTMKFIKFGPDGKLRWMAGRKDASQGGHGLLHIFWVIAGLIGNHYVVCGSEWGPMYFYTHDGFYVGSIMNNPDQAPMPGPYTFGSEIGSGFVRYFPAKNQVWAYVEGMAYKVLGFDHGKVQGQSRQWGQVALSKVYPSKWSRHTGMTTKATPLVISPLHKPWNNPAAWNHVPLSAVRGGGKLLAQAQLGYDAKYLCARIAVVDAKPIANAAHSATLAFNGGDSVGLDLGPAAAKGAKPVLGQVRILAALINGKPELIGMKPLSRRYHEKAGYYTPAGGHINFAFVGYIPGGKVSIVRNADGKGYVAILAVPRKFLALPLKPGVAIRADIEVNYSGYTNEGLKVVSRNYLFSPENGTTTMIDDIPTEARLNPQWWGKAVVK